MIENQRVRLSKHLLQEGLISLLVGKSIHKISVREICEKAQINRTTFYKYYGSQYDLLRDIENDVLSQIEDYLKVDDIQTMDDVRQLSKIMAYMNAHLTLCRLLINNLVDSEFPERLFQLPKIRHLLGSHLAEGYQNDEADYVYQFVVNGGFYMIKSWINQDVRENPEKIAVLLLDIVGKILK